jgi:hypothetical protein
MLASERGGEGGTEKGRKRGEERKTEKRESNELEDENSNSDRRCIEDDHRLVLLRGWSRERQRSYGRGRTEENAQPALLGNPRSAQPYGRTIDVKSVSQVPLEKDARG